ncbi:VOC family protein [Saccharothrix syringae]|uniref:Glyoxalase/bleomycin resistance/dioxygenase family protein n=1 Tax=Saccharothrix syringae TaxID=103733 RepID=A0A5Q0GVI8_SACSY|nr:VOC family protein [Saccharothrix syringae]QFZ17941.1 glyoxalase/bleomycin resistance/dioxygenase family protein [Saccharothrix syringae]
MRLTSVILDSADPTRLAAFYHEATGWPVVDSGEDYASLSAGDGLSLGFQRVQGYQGGGWPDDRKHAHVDFAVLDVDGTVAKLVALGASKPDFQPGGDGWTVVADPEGHLFCLSRAE